MGEEDQVQRTEQLKPRDDQVTGVQVADGLKENFLGTGTEGEPAYWPESDAMKARGILAQLPKEPSSEELALAVQKINALPLYEKSSSIKERKFDKDKAREVWLLNQWLKQTPELVEALLSGMRGFQEMRWEELEVPESKRVEGRNHVGGR